MHTPEPRLRPVRAILLSALALATAPFVTPAVAAGTRCHTQPRNVETLRVEALPGAALRGRVLLVEVRVVRDATSTPVEGADVSARLRSGKHPTFGGATTDEQGLTTVRLGLAADLRPGPAVLATEAWSEGTPGHWCVPAVNEHGYAETTVDVR